VAVGSKECFSANRRERKKESWMSESKAFRILVIDRPIVSSIVGSKNIIR